MEYCIFGLVWCQRNGITAARWSTGLGAAYITEIHQDWEGAEVSHDLVKAWNPKAEAKQERNKQNKYKTSKTLPHRTSPSETLPPYCLHCWIYRVWWSLPSSLLEHPWSWYLHAKHSLLDLFLEKLELHGTSANTNSPKGSKHHKSSLELSKPRGKMNRIATRLVKINTPTL